VRERLVRRGQEGHDSGEITPLDFIEFGEFLFEQVLKVQPTRQQVLL
jgi:hypothetical protein